METIQLSAYEKKDLIEILKYAKEQKELNRPIIEKTAFNSRRFDTTNYDISRIETLLNIIDSKNERISLNKKNGTIC